ASRGRPRRGVRPDARELVVGAAVEEAAGLALLDVAPLLEEEGDLLGAALTADRAHPGLVHRAGAGAALAADDDPVDAGEVELAEVFEERLDGEEADRGRGVVELFDPGQAVLAILDAHAEPDLR